MVLLVFLLLAIPALAQPADAQPADCPAQEVGPPMDVGLSLERPTRAKAQAPATGWLGLQDIPSLGTECQAPPPPATDVLHGPPAPRGLLRGDGPTDVLQGALARPPPPGIGPQR